MEVTPLLLNEHFILNILCVTVSFLEHFQLLFKKYNKVMALG